MARTNKEESNVLSRHVIEIMDNEPSYAMSPNAVWEWYKSTRTAHHGLTLDSSNRTAFAATYFESMGMAQSFLDVGSVNYSNIAGVDSDGNVPKGSWDLAKCRKHAARLGLTAFDGTVEARKTLAETWIADARNSKWTRILNGELVHDGESRGPRLDPIESYVRDTVSNIILTAAKKANDSRPKKDRQELPKGKALSDAIAAYMANDANVAKLAKVRELATLNVALTTE